MYLFNAGRSINHRCHSLRVSAWQDAGDVSRVRSSRRWEGSFDLSRAGTENLLKVQGSSSVLSTLISTLVIISSFIYWERRSRTSTNPSSGRSPLIELVLVASSCLLALVSCFANLRFSIPLTSFASKSSRLRNVLQLLSAPSAFLLWCRCRNVLRWVRPHPCNILCGRGCGVGDTANVSNVMTSAGQKA